MSNLVVARVLVSMVANSASAPTTPTRRGVIKDDEVYLGAAEQYPHDEGFLLTKELHIATPGGGQFYLSRLTPPNPADEGVVKPDRRTKEYRTGRPPEVDARIVAYSLMVEADEEIQFEPYSPHLLERFAPRREEMLGRLAESIKIGTLD